MSRCLWIVIGAALLYASLALSPGAGAVADEESRPQIQLEVGAQHEVGLGLVGVRILCDDLEVARVDDQDDRLRVVGVGPGQTRCSFWQDPKSRAPARLFDVTVARAASAPRPTP
jgi:hypothetical protein